MAHKLIELEDGTLVEVDATERELQDISHGRELIRGATVDQIKPLLLRITRPMTEVWRELNKDLEVQEAEVELGLGFEGEGNLFVAKTKGSANLVIRLKLAPKPEAEPPAADSERS